MDDLKLEPYAVVLNFTFPDIQDRWEELLSQFLIEHCHRNHKIRKSGCRAYQNIGCFPRQSVFPDECDRTKYSPNHGGENPLWQNRIRDHPECAGLRHFEERN